jgi:Multiubiquitin
VSDHDHQPVQIIIDNHTFHPRVTGRQLRHLPDPPVSEKYELYLEVHGGEDKLIHEDEEVELRDKMVFFTVERHITPGSSC